MMTIQWIGTLSFICILILIALTIRLTLHNKNYKWSLFICSLISFIFVYCVILEWQGIISEQNSFASNSAKNNLDTPKMDDRPDILLKIELEEKENLKKLGWDYDNMNILESKNLSCAALSMRNILRTFIRPQPLESIDSFANMPQKHIGNIISIGDSITDKKEILEGKIKDELVGNDGKLIALSFKQTLKDGNIIHCMMLFPVKNTDTSETNNIINNISTLNVGGLFIGTLDKENVKYFVFLQ